MKKGATIDKQDNVGDTALAYATACSQTSVAEALLDGGANPNIPNSVGMTPTLTACCIGHELTLLALLQHVCVLRLQNLTFLIVNSWVQQKFDVRTYLCIFMHHSF